jgi:FtsH-binding integral membrane protein
VAVAIVGACAIGITLVLLGLTYFSRDILAVLVIALLCLGAFAAFVYNWRSEASLLGSIDIAWVALCVTAGALFFIPLSGALLWGALLSIVLPSGWWSLLEVLFMLAVVSAGAIVGRAIARSVP